MGGYPVRKLVLPEKDIGCMALWRLNSKCWNRLADGLCDLGCGITFAKILLDSGKAGLTPFELLGNISLGVFC